jgi:hypothetical protein
MSFTLGDSIGYVWAAAFGGKLPERVLGGIIPPKISHPETCLGKTESSIAVPVVNERQKQTYYGAINYLQRTVLVLCPELSATLIQLRMSGSKLKRGFADECSLANSFLRIKWLFEWFLQNTTFDFSKLQMYGDFSKIQWDSYS